ncbi:MAG: hypothetical protein HOB73_06080 [Planctomycetaceae bacterium]|jgi:hypothetical protein|nr:hypothetical protein [Planctomycetaceae bacterium]
MSERTQKTKGGVIALWGFVYVLLMVAIIFKMLDSRSQILNASSNQREIQQAGWDDWTKYRGQQASSTNQVAPNLRGTLNPQRLLEDHFAICLAAILLFTTLIYGVTMYLFCGAVLGSTQGPVTLADEIRTAQDTRSVHSDGNAPQKKESID